MNHKPISIGGVPEHFNYPWKFAGEIGMLGGADLNVQWRDEPAGTGALLDHLIHESLDLAVVLTEGAVKFIAANPGVRILGSFVCSPLIWGIHVASNSGIQRQDDLNGKKYAISRKGSGSHLMACVEALNRNEKINEHQWFVCNGLEGARAALRSGEADVLLWEKFMTSPLVNSGEFRRIGECLTPWPCFVICVRDDFAISQRNRLERLLHTIQSACRMFMFLPDASQIIADHYGLSLKDARDWFNSVEWQVSNSFSKKALNNAQYYLKQAEILDKTMDAGTFISSITTLV